MEYLDIILLFYKCQKVSKQACCICNKFIHFFFLIHIYGDGTCYVQQASVQLEVAFMMIFSCLYRNTKF